MIGATSVMALDRKITWLTTTRAVRSSMLAQNRSTSMPSAPGGSSTTRTVEARCSLSRLWWPGQSTEEITTVPRAPQSIPLTTIAMSAATFWWRVTDPSGAPIRPPSRSAVAATSGNQVVRHASTPSVAQASTKSARDPGTESGIAPSELLIR